VVIDLDATNDLLHGSQQGRFFHGYYGNYRYLTLYAFIGEVPVWTELRTSQSDASKGSLCALRAIVPRFAGAARTPGSSCGGTAVFAATLTAWCEEQQRCVYYCFGLARNSRPLEELEEAFFRARATVCLNEERPGERKPSAKSRCGWESGPRQERKGAPPFGRGDGGLACSWEEDLVEHIDEVIGEERRARWLPP
jgi:hypothetical protein